MSLWQRIYGAGARLFGPPQKRDRQGEAGEIDQSHVVAAIIALGAKMAKADGQVRREEVIAFKKIFRADPSSEAMIGQFFDLARQTIRGYQQHAYIVARHFRARPSALEDILDGLFYIALADNILTDDELTYLQNVSDIFGLSEREFLRIKNAHLGLATEDPYLILGVDETISDEDLKKAYRRIARANHPDAMMAKGLPKELLGLAGQKMAMINRAYDQIKAERGLNETAPKALE